MYVCRLASPAEGQKRSNDGYYGIWNANNWLNTTTTDNNNNNNEIAPIEIYEPEVRVEVEREREEMSELANKQASEQLLTMGKSPLSA